MYRPTSKPLHWELEANLYRRPSQSRRIRNLIRNLIISSIVLLSWYRYSRSATLQQHVFDIDNQPPYQSEREKVFPISPDPENKIKSRDSPLPIIHSDLNLQQRLDIVNDATSVTSKPRKDEITNGHFVNPPANGVEKIDDHKHINDGESAEIEAQDGLRKQAILDTRPKEVSGWLDIMREPTRRVKEASEKLVEQHLTPAVAYSESKGESTENTNEEWRVRDLRFPSYSAYVALDEQGQALPDVIHVPFEVSTANVKLEGWEDQWYSEAELNVAERGEIPEPKIDFIYTWVNGSEVAFQETMYPYEVNSSLNDPEGTWLESHRVNRYRDWDELRYSIRSVEHYAASFMNKIQLLVNAVADPEDVAEATVENSARIIGKQRPSWLKDDAHTRNQVQVLSQEDFFDEAEQGCLPTFNSLTIENQIFNTKSTTDRMFALSDDMLLGKPHAASDIYSPLFGPTMGFKANSYNTVNPPTDVDARRFGEKPFLIYSSWLLNRRFGERKRRGQIHFGHSLSRSVSKEAIKSFPRPALQSACQRFRGETGFQLYSWYVAFHYTIERHREALLWSYIMLRSDTNRDGNLGWDERQTIMQDLEEGMKNEGETEFRKRMFYHMSESLEAAGLEAPKVNVDVQWTSLDGPIMIQNIECFEFNVNECLAPGFSTSSSDAEHTNYMFDTAAVFDRVARQHPKCGDCLIKLLLNRAKKGLSPLLPFAKSQAAEREVAIKALWKYQYVIVDPDAYFVMVTDAEQVENVLFKRLTKRKGTVGQLCLNDDVSTEEEGAVADVRRVMIKLLASMVPKPSSFELTPEEETHTR